MDDGQRGGLSCEADGWSYVDGDGGSGRGGSAEDTISGVADRDAV